MTTIRDLAAEFGMQEFELEAFSDDLLDGLGSNDEIPAETEAFIREALTHVDTEPTTAQINDREDAVLGELAEIVEAAGHRQDAVIQQLEDVIDDAGYGTIGNNGYDY